MRVNFRLILVTVYAEIDVSQNKLDKIYWDFFLSASSGQY